MNNYFELDLVDYSELVIYLNDYLTRNLNVSEFLSESAKRYTFYPMNIDSNILSHPVISNLENKYGPIVGSAFHFFKYGGHITTMKSSLNNAILMLPLILTEKITWSWIDYDREETLIVEKGVPIYYPKYELLGKRVDSYTQTSKPLFVRTDKWYSAMYTGRNPLILCSLNFLNSTEVENQINS